MTAPRVTANVLGHGKVAYYSTVLGANDGPGPYSSATLSLVDLVGAPLTGPTDAGVVLVVGFWTAVNASGVLPQVTSIGGDLTFSQYIDRRQDGLVPAFWSGSTTPGQMSTELWWAHSDDPLDPDATFTLNFDPPLSFASNKGAMLCFGYVISGCATPVSPWDPRLDLPHVTSLAPSTGPDFTTWMLSNGATATFSDGVYQAHLIWGASALVGTDGEELALMLDCFGGRSDGGGADILSGWTPYSSGWEGNIGSGVSGLYGAPDLNGALAYRPFSAPIAFDGNPTIVLFPPDGSDLTAVGTATAGIGEFSKAILSVWFCRDSDEDASYVFQSATSDPATSHGAYFKFRYDGSQWVIQVKLYHTNTSTPVLDGTFTAASTPVHTLVNVLLSFDASIQTIQVYVNDTAATVSSGSWSSSATVNAGTISDWTLTGSINFLGVAEFYFAPGFFRDLSQAVNRRAFISADARPVTAVGGFPVSGGGFAPLAFIPTGIPPPIFLSSRTFEADDFYTNYGTDGSWALINGPLAVDNGCNAPYSIVEVLFPRTVVDGTTLNAALDSTASGIGNFTKALLSLWFCRGPGPSGLTFETASDDPATSYGAYLRVGYEASDPWTVLVRLYNTDTSTQIYDGNYTAPATTVGTMVNVLLSFDTETHAIQVYFNETAGTITPYVDITGSHSGDEWLA